jgi:hypothetical protein
MGWLTIFNRNLKHWCGVRLIPCVIAHHIPIVIIFTVTYLKIAHLAAYPPLNRTSSPFPVWPVSRPPMHRRGTTTRRCSDGRLDPAGPFHDSAMCTR